MGRISKMLGVAGILFAIASGAAHADTLRVLVDALPTTSDPHRYNTSTSFNLSSHVFEPLVYRDRNLKPVAGLATEWSRQDDLTWRFEMRQGVNFHDGSNFDATDVIYSLCRIQRGGPAAYGGVFYAVDQASAADGAVLIKTKRPFALMPNMMTTVLIVPSPPGWNGMSFPGDCKGLPEQEKDVSPKVGTGPFVFSSFDGGVSATLRRYDGYWGTAPEWTQVSLRSEPDAERRAKALIRQEADVISNVSLDSVATLSAVPKVKITMSDMKRTVVLGFGFGDGDDVKFSQDVRFRQAIYHGINRTLIAQDVMQGVSEPAGQIMPPSLPGYNPDLPADPYDPVLAQKLLISAGYMPGTPFRVYALPNDMTVAKAIALQLEKIGVAMQVRPIADLWASGKVKDLRLEGVNTLGGWTALNGELGSLALSSLATKNADTFTGAENYNGFSSPRIDDLLEMVFQTHDPDHRSAVMIRLARYITEELPSVPVLHVPMAWAMRIDLSYKGRVDGLTLAQDIHKLDR